MSTLHDAANTVRDRMATLPNGALARIGCNHAPALTACGACYARAMAALGEIARGADGPAMAESVIEAIRAEVRS
jgi:hypothetical protein